MEDRKMKFIEKANKKFNNYYNYDKFVYINSLSKGIVTCPIHGDFEVIPESHVSTDKYCGCKKCLKEKKENILHTECKNAAFKYETKKDFQAHDRYHYNMAHKHGWIDEICSHMRRLGNLYHRCIYVYEFVDLKSAYIGLTFDIENRHKQHANSSESSSVYLFSKENHVKIPTPKQLTDYVDKDEAAKLENVWIDNYKNHGWSIINKVKGGALGGRNRHVNYTKKDCFEIASRYDKVSDCEKENFKVCQILRKKGWIKEAFSQVFDKFKIVCFNSNGDFFKEYDSPTSASIDLGINISGISSCVTKNRGYTNNYQFMKYFDWIKKGSPNKIDKINFDSPNCVEIVQLSRDGEFLNDFNTIADAVKFLGREEKDRSSLTKACKGRLKTAYGHKWMYKEDYNKMVDSEKPI